MTIEDMKATYRRDKAKAVVERAKLEKMRSAFTKRCAKVGGLERGVHVLRGLIVDALLEREGLEP